MRANFSDWLKQEGAYDRFIQNFDGEFDDDWGIDNNGYLIDYAFEWEYTPEGDEYWCDLCAKLEKYCSTGTIFNDLFYLKSSPTKTTWSI